MPSGEWIHRHDAALVLQSFRSSTSILLCIVGDLLPLWRTSSLTFKPFEHRLDVLDVVGLALQAGWWSAKAIWLAFRLNMN